MRKLLLALIVSGCGGGTTNESGTSVNGAVKGTAFNAKDASYVSTSTWKSGFSPGVTTAVTITDFAGLCAQSNASGAPKSAQVLILALATMDSAGTSSLSATVGDYQVVSLATSPAGPAGARIAWVYWEQTGADCLKSTQSEAKPGVGKVTVTSFGGGAIAGTFDVTFDTNAHVTGNFSATACGTLAAWLNGGPNCG